jgi:hypothetical protein
MTKITIAQKDDRNASPFAATVQFNDGPRYPAAVTDPFSPEEEERLRWYFEEWLTFPFTGQVKAAEAAASAVAYGERLFDQLFRANADILAEYKMAWRDGGFAGLEFEIRGTPAFHALHWEALKDPQHGRPFAVECPFWRQNDNPPPQQLQPQPAATLNVLLVTARPGGRHDVGYRTIARPLVAARQNGKLRAQIDLVRPGSYAALVRHLEESRDARGDGYYQIVHFDLHGSLLTYEQYQQAEAAVSPHFFKSGYGQKEIAPYPGYRAFLSFNGAAAGQSDLVADEIIAELLQSHKIPIAILNACQSGMQVGDSETSLGARLMAAGVQLALAMGYSVTVSAAELLMTQFYQQLLAGKPPIKPCARPGWNCITAKYGGPLTTSRLSWRIGCCPLSTRTSRFACLCGTTRRPPPLIGRRRAPVSANRQPLTALWGGMWIFWKLRAACCAKGRTRPPTSC